MRPCSLKLSTISKYHFHPIQINQNVCIFLSNILNEQAQRSLSSHCRFYSCLSTALKIEVQCNRITACMLQPVSAPQYLQSHIYLLKKPSIVSLIKYKSRCCNGFHSFSVFMARMNYHCSSRNKACSKCGSGKSAWH